MRLLLFSNVALSDDGERIQHFERGKVYSFKDEPEGLAQMILRNGWGIREEEVPSETRRMLAANQEGQL